MHAQFPDFFPFGGLSHTTRLDVASFMQAIQVLASIHMQDKQHIVWNCIGEGGFDFGGGGFGLTVPAANVCLQVSSMWLAWSLSQPLVNVLRLNAEVRNTGMALTEPCRKITIACKVQIWTNFGQIFGRFLDEFLGWISSKLFEWSFLDGFWGRFCGEKPWPQHPIPIPTTTPGTKFLRAFLFKNIFQVLQAFQNSTPTFHLLMVAGWQINESNLRAWSLSIHAQPKPQHPQFSLSAHCLSLSYKLRVYIYIYALGSQYFDHLFLISLSVICSPDCQ